MEEIRIEKAIELAKKKGLKPGKVKGTDGVHFIKKESERIEIIDWDEFRKTISKRRLKVYEAGGWMKIMKKGRPRVAPKAKKPKTKREDVRKAFDDAFSFPTDEDLTVLAELGECVIINMLIESSSKGEVTLESILQLVRGSKR